jgi:hypothetical protein
MADVIRKLRSPAVALICLGVLNVMSAVVLLLGRLANLIKGNERVIADEAERLGYQTAMIYFPLVSLLSIGAAPLIIIGGVQMLSARKYSLAILAAILAMIPLTSVCCLPGIGIGLWALIVLRNPEVKAAFQASQNPIR